MGSPCKILVYLDQKPLYVPEHVNDPWAFRGALGLRRGEAVIYSYQGAQSEIVTALGGFTFRADMSFKITNSERPMYPPVAEGEAPGIASDEPPMPWENEGEAWKR